jgi:hypothetical protein
MSDVEEGKSIRSRSRLAYDYPEDTEIPTEQEIICST